MYKSALTSINKPHTDNIFAIDESERKTVEWRTKPLPKGKHYVYETKNKGGCGKVIGEMTVLGWIKLKSVDDFPDEIIRNGKVSREFIKAYAKGRPVYANILYGAKRYDKPKNLGEFRKPCNATYHCRACVCSKVEKIKDGFEYKCYKDFRLTRPPQSWCYVEGV